MKKKFDIALLFRLAALFLVLWGGKLVWEQFGQPANFDETLLETSFQYWFWLQRGPDLAVQAGLIFAGALGIAALLPGSKDKEQ